jgi:hypothetical protein
MTVRFSLLSFVISMGLSVAACGGSTGKDVKDPSDEARAVEPMVRDECEGPSEKMVDVNGDGRANIRHVFDGPRELCAEVDLNFDGRVDITRIYGDDGKLAREQHDFDFDGRLDQMAFYEAGVLVRKQLDTNFDSLSDTWVWCSGPMIARLERDRRHSGQVDTWEEYQSGRLSAVRYDHNNDGKVDRWETYKDGLLTEYSGDMDLDGKPDHPEKVESAGAGQALEPVSCNGLPLPGAEEEKPATQALDQTKAAPPPPPIQDAPFIEAKPDAGAGDEAAPPAAPAKGAK